MTTFTAFLVLIILILAILLKKEQTKIFNFMDMYKITFKDRPKIMLEINNLIKKCYFKL